jgi:hypothetical protein
VNDDRSPALCLDAEEWICPTETRATAVRQSRSDVDRAGLARRWVVCGGSDARAVDL